MELGKLEGGMGTGVGIPVVLAWADIRKSPPSHHTSAVLAHHTPAAGRAELDKAYYSAAHNPPPDPIHGSHIQVEAYDHLDVQFAGYFEGEVGILEQQHLL